MLVSYSWLQKYFTDPLPGAEKVVEVLTFGVAEVESVEKKEKDTVIDVKVLPDRAGYLLGHRGIASELSVLLGISMKEDPLRNELPELTPAVTNLELKVDNTIANPVHTLGLVEGVSVQPSPPWLVEALEAVGQRSINNIVDATNYVLLDIGQPTHVFDADKLKEEDGTLGIRVRPSEKGEKITLLGGAELELPEGVEMLCDVHTNAPLDVAGIKGGVHAELTDQTERIVITAAAFNPTLIRKTAAKLGIKTDAVKRFENTVPEELPLYGMKAVVHLITELAGGEVRGYKTVQPQKKLGFKLGVSTSEVNRVLGTSMKAEDVESVLRGFGWQYQTVADPCGNIVEEAMKCVGAAYKADSAFRSDAPHTFSCSSLTNYVAVLSGISMPSVSVDQYVWGTPVSEKDAQSGDLVFANTGKGKIWQETFQFLPGTEVPEGVDHVGVYLGDGKVLHATREYGKVVVENIKESRSFKTVVGYRRVASEESRFVVDVPFYRSDLRIKEDLIEEIARVHGYDKINGAHLNGAQTSPTIDSTRFAAEKVRGALIKAGFTEILTYALRAKGKAELRNPLASDKAFLRENLSEGMAESIEKAEYYLPLTGMHEVKIFEIGTVFGTEDEHMHVCVGVRAATGKKRVERTRALLDAAETILAEVGIPKNTYTRTEETIECVLPSLKEAAAAYPDAGTVAPGIIYTPLSPYPFVLRDIALWVPENIDKETVRAHLIEHAGSMVQRVDMFDEFKKDNRVSYAFHLVFQSQEKTLSDDEVNKWMSAVYATCKENGWETR